MQPVLVRTGMTSLTKLTERGVEADSARNPAQKVRATVSAANLTRRAGRFVNGSRVVIKTDCNEISALSIHFSG